MKPTNKNLSKRSFKNYFRHSAGILVLLFLFIIVLIGATFFVDQKLGPRKTAEAAFSCVAQATGNWNVGATWSTCGADGPVAGDSVTINAAYVVTLTANAAVADVTVSAGTLAIVTYNLAISGNTTVSGGAVTIGISATNGLTTTDLTINSGSITCSGASKISISGSYSNAGTFTASTGTVTFTATSGGKTLSGRLNNAVTNSAFYKIAFNGVGGEWSINDAMLVSAANATDTFVIGNGTVTLGNGVSDNLEVDGKMTIAATAGQTGTFQTFALAQTAGTITFDLNNNATLPSCPNCIITVGATSGVGQGNLKIRKNTVLRLNPRSIATVSDTGIETESTGYLEIQGSQDATGTSSGTTNETTLTDSGKSWTAGEHVGKIVRMTGGLAIGMIYDITANSGTSLTRATTESASGTVSSLSDSGNAKKICSGSTTMITVDNEGIGRYIKDVTGGVGYLQLVDSTNDDVTCSTKDSFLVAAQPDTVSILAVSDTITISDGIKQNDAYEILDYASVTAENGTNCDAASSQAGEAYILGKAGSENLIRYADICDLGRQAANYYGTSFYSVNGANANEGVTVDKSRTRSGYRGIYLESSSNANLSNNQIYSNAGDGVSLLSASNNTISNNQSYSNTIYGYHLNASSNNTLSSNQSRNNASRAIYLSTSSNNNTLTANQAYNTPGRGIYLSASSNNTLYANYSFGNTSNGFHLTSSSNNTFFNNYAYASPRGLDIDTIASTGNISIADNFGSLAPNTTADINFVDANAHQLKLYNTTLASTTEVTGTLGAGAYIISRKHDGVAGASKIWGQYATPTQVSETPQDETSENYNYADNLWEKSATSHNYVGTGTEDANLDYDISSADLSSGPYNYRAVVNNIGTDGKCASAVKPTFDVYRNNVDTGLDATCGSLFTDTNGSVNVKFKIDGGTTTGYIIGDGYTFTTFGASSDTNITKSATFQQDGGIYSTAGTLSLNGDATHFSTLSTITGSFDLTNNGVITGSYNTLTIPGTISGSGSFSMSTGSAVINRIAAAKNFGSTSGGNNWTFQNLKFENSSAGNLAVTTAAGGTGQIITGGNLTIGNAGDTNSTTLDNETNDRILDINGDIVITSKGVLSASSTATFTVAGNWSNAGTFSANTSAIIFDGSSGQTITSNGQQFNNLSITNNSASGLTFADSTTVAGTFTNITPSSKLTFHAGSTFTFTNININGGNTSTRISLLSSAPGNQWFFNVAQLSPTAPNVRVQDSNAGGGSQINAVTGGLNLGNNTNWLFDQSVVNVTVSPNPATLYVGDNVTFTATAYDLSGFAIPGTVFTWSVIVGGGIIDSSGLFFAGSMTGIFSDTVKATASGISGYATVAVNQIQNGGPTLPRGSTTPPALTVTAPESGAASPSPLNQKLPSEALEEEPILTSIIDKIINLAGKIYQTGKELTKKVIISSSKNAYIKALTATTAIATTSSLGIVTTIGVVATQMTLNDFILVIANFLLSIFAIKKKDKFGMVYDAETGRPVSRALVLLYEAATVKHIASAITDKTGHFIFTARPGNYVLSVVKPGYIFPSKLAEQNQQFGNIYRGQIVTVSEKSPAVNVQIPIDINLHAESIKKKAIPIFNIETIRVISLVFGSIISITALALEPKLINYLMAGLFVIMWSLQFAILNRMLKFSTVIGQKDKQPVNLAIVRVVSPEGKYIQTYVSDHQGKVLPNIEESGQGIIVQKGGFESTEYGNNRKGLVEHKRFFLSEKL